MTIITLSEETLLHQLMQQGAIVITPNKRLSNQLLTDFFSQSTEAVVDKPVCLPYSSFLHHLYKKLIHNKPFINHPIVLTPIQEYALWRKVLIQDDTFSEGLLQEIQSAWSTCRQWQIAIDHADFSKTPQTQQFRRWQEQFQELLTKHYAITQDQLVNYILKHLDVIPVRPLIWVCFNEFTPEQKALQEALLARSSKQYHFERFKESQSTLHYPAKDEQDEEEQMLAWVKSRLDAGDKRIGIVDPALQTQSQRLKRLIQRRIPNVPFNISLGEPLTNHPLVAHALHWIQLTLNQLSNETARLLLLSPYLRGSKSEFLKRAEYLQNNKLLKESVISFELFLNSLREDLPLLFESLTDIEPYPKNATPREWIDYFKRRLIKFGFPGEYSLNSACYQYLQRLEGIFEEFLQLTAVTDYLSEADALACLLRLARTTIFQIKQPTSSVQVLGLLEASGCRFDSVWVCGVNDQTLPQKTRLSAFIPIELQRRLNMPKSLPEKELKLAVATLNQLRNGSKHSVFSYACLLGDTPALPSPLIRELPLYEPTRIVRESIIKRVLREEIYSLPLLSNELFSGGTAVLGNQAKCPFRAFAAHRLHAKASQSITAGPDASERGQMLHKIMEKIWQRFGNQKTLLTLSSEALETEIEKVIEETVGRYTEFRFISFPSFLKQIEHHRLKTLIQACLDWEKERPAFAVKAIEQTYTIELAGIPLTLRVDRLDQVGPHTWVIDYKTTLPTNKPWNSDRPEEPQMLLYALLDDQINTLLFLQLKAGKLSLSGLSAEHTDLSGIKSLKSDQSWHEMRGVWREQLSLLAEEFREGYCPPKPTRASICQQCDFPNLCRAELQPL
ncbi:PD-(D/E)XK nuclease family protein [Legionella impletisoli]|uniref:Endonuclease n=1 Tax=Legionella impletisoli TaxID=343510 RepID=A0A917NCK4_9GAMM|nr:PD-(D/E)XK nuclease family protein [Legionella impletisoli]GGI89411.1 endonuclease [Legionella impletisoli]